jgi:small multidrug resistance family-3 protein
MRPPLALLLLLGAAVLEAGGDAIVRRGLHADSAGWRFCLILVGGLVLMAYGVAVNLPPWDFGRLLGVYVTLFFLVAQVINVVAFGVAPSLPIIVGGALVIAGGVVMTVWQG